MPTREVGYKCQVRCCGKKFSSKQEAIDCERRHDEEKVNKLAEHLHRESPPHDERYCAGGQCMPHYIKEAEKIITLLGEFDKE